MSTSTEGIPVPSWDLADRLRKCLRESDMSVQEMADYLEVSRNTVSAWINGRTPPSTQSIRLVALRTGVPYEWLREGIVPEQRPDGPDDGVVRPKGFEPPTFWAGVPDNVICIFPEPEPADRARRSA